MQPGERRGERWIPRLFALGLGLVLLWEYAPQLRAWFAPLDAGPHLPSAAPTAPTPTALPAPTQSPTAAAPLPAPVAPEAPLAAPRLRRRGPLTGVDDFSSEGMEAELGPDGQVLLTSKYAVQRYAGADLHDRRRLFSPQLYLEQFPEGRPQALASALALPGERYVLGGWHGEVLFWEDGRLRQLSDGQRRPRGRIADLLAADGEVWVAGDGLWRLRADGQGLQEIPTPGLGRIRALAQRPGGPRLVGADVGGIHRWTGERLEPWLALPPEVGQLQMLVPARDGRWLLGTNKGLYRLPADGSSLDVLLAGVWVTAVAEPAAAPDELWVGSWRQGLLLRRGGRWFRLGGGEEGLPVEAVSGLVIDPQDRLWLTLYGGGAWQAPRTALAESLRAWAPGPDPQD
ncbi:MAG TPA: hypothetical protein VFV11_04630 [Solimonas sp.]|nr:hypothetical protein [Solimonas sp.]